MRSLQQPRTNLVEHPPGPDPENQGKDKFQVAGSNRNCSTKSDN